MLIENQVFYQGPGQPTVRITNGDTVTHCRFEQVGTSLFRNLIDFEWEPMLTVEETPGQGAIEISHSTFIGGKKKHYIRLSYAISYLSPRFTEVK